MEDKKVKSTKQAEKKGTKKGTKKSTKKVVETKNESTTIKRDYKKEIQKRNEKYSRIDTYIEKEYMEKMEKYMADNDMKRVEFLRYAIETLC